MIRKRGNKFILFSLKSHKKLGEFPTLKAAKKREKQINFFKYLESKKK